MEDKMEDKEAREICWELFKETGEVTYYMLYKALEE